MSEKPLFIPLKAEYYEAFENGTKDTEYRRYGKIWNENNCRPGRTVTLSYGYGKARRMKGTVIDFHIVGADAYPGIRAVYPEGDTFAAIKIKLS